MSYSSSKYQPFHNEPPSYQATYQPSYQQPTGVHSISSSKMEDKFPKNYQFRDPFWFLLFVVHLGVVFVLFIVGTSRYQNNPNYSDEILIDLQDNQFKKLVLICLLCSAFSFCLSIVYLSLARSFARQLIIGTSIASVIIFIVFGIYFFIIGSIFGGIFMLLMAALNGFFFYLWRSRIDFASAILETVAKVLQYYPASYYIAYLSLIVQFVAVSIIAWSSAVSQLYSGNSAYLIFVFFIFSLFWTTQVIKNVVHVTTSGSVATWYFLQNEMPHNPTISAFKRAVTTSFGSICLGSLLVALLQTLRTLISTAKNSKNSFITLIVDCILGFIENLVRYFNIYAFAQVAIYGKTYCDAARDTWALIHSHGIEAIINDNLINNVLTIGSLITAFLCGLLGGIVGYLIAPQYYVACIVLSIIIGFTMMIVATEVIHSSVATIFVCFALDREALRKNDPNLYQKFVETYYV